MKPNFPSTVFRDCVNVARRVCWWRKYSGESCVAWNGEMRKWDGNFLEHGEKHLKKEREPFGQIAHPGISTFTSFGENSSKGGDICGLSSLFGLVPLRRLEEVLGQGKMCSVFLFQWILIQRACKAWLWGGFQGEHVIRVFSLVTQRRVAGIFGCSRNSFNSFGL